MSEAELFLTWMEQQLNGANNEVVVDDNVVGEWASDKVEHAGFNDSQRKEMKITFGDGSHCYLTAEATRAK